MSDTERASETRTAARTISGILCSMFAAGLCMWGIHWVRWITSGRGIGALFVGLLVILSSLSQLCVALLFITACVMHFPDSPNARRYIQVAGIRLLREIPLVIVPFVLEIASVEQ